MLSPGKQVLKLGCPQSHATMKLAGEILVDKQPSPRSYKLMKYNAYLENIKMLVARTL